MAKKTKEQPKVEDNNQRIFKIVNQRIFKIVAEQLGLKLDDVKPESTMDELGGDSLDAVELIMAIEEEFELEITDDDGMRMKTVAHVCEFVNTGKMVHADEERAMEHRNYIGNNRTKNKPDVKKAKKAKGSAKAIVAQEPVSIGFNRPHVKGLMIDDAVKCSVSRKKKITWQARGSELVLADNKTNREYARIEIVLSEGFNGWNMYVPCTLRDDLLLISKNVFSDSELATYAYISGESLDATELMVCKLVASLGFMKYAIDDLVNLKHSTYADCLTNLDSLTGLSVNECVYDFYRFEAMTNTTGDAKALEEELEELQQSADTFFRDLPEFCAPKKCVPVDPAPVAESKTNGMVQKEKEEADFLADKFEECELLDTLRTLTTHDLLRMAVVVNCLDEVHSDGLALRESAISALLGYEFTFLDGYAKRLGLPFCRPFA